MISSRSRSRISRCRRKFRGARAARRRSRARASRRSRSRPCSAVACSRGHRTCSSGRSRRRSSARCSPWSTPRIDPSRCSRSSRAHSAPLAAHRGPLHGARAVARARGAHARPCGRPRGRVHPGLHRGSRGCVRGDDSSTGSWLPRTCRASPISSPRGSRRATRWPRSRSPRASRLDPLAGRAARRARRSRLRRARRAGVCVARGCERAELAPVPALPPDDRRQTSSSPRSHSRTRASPRWRSRGACYRRTTARGRRSARSSTATIARPAISRGARSAIACGGASSRPGSRRSGGVRRSSRREWLPVAAPRDLEHRAPRGRAELVVDPAPAAQADRELRAAPGSRYRRAPRRETGRASQST